MMRISAILLLLLANTAVAAEIIPSIGPAFDPKYRTAADKAQRAFLLQVGVTQQINKAFSLLEGDSRHVVARLIDDNTPLNSNDVFFVAAVGYTAAIKREFVQRFRNPFWANVSHTVSLGLQHQAITMQIPF